MPVKVVIALCSKGCGVVACMLPVFTPPADGEQPEECLAVPRLDSGVLSGERTQGFFSEGAGPTIRRPSTPPPAMHIVVANSASIVELPVHCTVLPVHNYRSLTSATSQREQ